MRCHVVVYVVMGVVVVVASGSSPSVYIRGLIRRIDRDVPNGLTRDLTVAGSIPECGKLSFRRFFASHQ